MQEIYYGNNGNIFLDSFQRSHRLRDWYYLFKQNKFITLSEVHLWNLMFLNFII